MKVLIATKKKTVIILSAILLFIILAGVGALLIYNSGRLSRALKKMDIDKKPTVTTVLKYANDDEEILLDIAKKYLKAKKPSEAVSILWHILQNVNSDCDSAKQLLKEHYGGGIMAEQVDATKKTATVFDVKTKHSGVGYGGTDGVYCSDFDGKIRYKLSSARATSFSAATGGVYILDGADNCVKFISRDGARVELVKKDVREFIYFESYIYAIGFDNKISGSREITLAEGEIPSTLRTFDHQVICDIYDSEYNLLRTEVLN